MSDAFQFLVIAGKSVVYRAEVMENDPVSLCSVANEAVAYLRALRSRGAMVTGCVYTAEEQRNGEILRLDPVGEQMEDFSKFMGWIQ